MARLVKPQPLAADPHAEAMAPADTGRATQMRRRLKRGLALAGGGPLGAMYEVGVLMALDESLIGLDLNDMDVYVGVSAGSVITAGLANQLSPQDIFRLFIENKAAGRRIDALSPEVFLRPAYREFWKRARSVPPLLLKALWRYLAHPLSGGALENFAALSRALPTGIFDNDRVRAYLHRAFSEPGRSDDFRQLKHKLFSIATDLDTGESVRFGAPGFDHIPISQAVQASAALPGLFPPVEIENRYFVDGALKKTLNASVALEEGARLVLAINPLVPFDANHARRRGRQEMEKLVEGGLPTVLSQTFRSIIHSRMHVGLQKYVTQYRNADVVLFEPASDDAEIFFTNLFSYATRRQVCEHAYQKTRKDLLARRHELGPVLAKYGIELDLAALRDTARTLDRRIQRKRAPTRRQQLKDVEFDLGEAIAELERFVKRGALA
jgi:predicted acylesterase/phospholipase RssA